jgi:malate dehydrogenase (oxaloacetate-decarboxylating)
MKLAAAAAIAGCISRDELGEEYIVPSIFNKQVTRRVAHAVEVAAHDTGVAKRRHG